MSTSHCLLLLSAETESALDMATKKLGEQLKCHPEQDLASLAYTLQVKSPALSHRRMLLCSSREEAITVIESNDTSRMLTAHQNAPDCAVVFMFPGVGDHYAGMAQALYLHQPVFKAYVDRSCDLLIPLIRQDLRSVLYTSEPVVNQPETGIDLQAMLGRHKSFKTPSLLNQTLLAQTAVFVTEYALAQLLIHWGIHPHAMIGYSVGEYVAACLAGVVSLEDALTLVAGRAEIIQNSPEGAMLAVALPEEKVKKLLGKTLSLASVNGPSMCVVAGETAATEALAEQLQRARIACRRLETSHAFHSYMMEPLREPVTNLARHLRFLPGQLRYVSNVTGQWITPHLATNPDYWADHMCRCVRFSEGLATLLEEAPPVLLEIGPGQSLGSFAKLHPANQRAQSPLILPTIRYAYDRQSDVGFLLNTVGKLWLIGTSIDWKAFHGEWEEFSPDDSN